VTCCAATSALDHQRCDHCATLCERAGRAAEWPRDEPDFDAAVTEWRAAAEIGEETARGVIALAARTQRPQHALHFLAQLRTRTNLVNLPSSSRLYPSPLGVVLIIGPWNFPLQLLLIPAIGAIAAGNAVVLKPSEYAPATAQLISKMIHETFPENLVQVVEGDGAELVPAMMNQFRFDHVFYTGSIPVGKAIYQLAAKDLVPVTLELGGKDPCVVEADASLEVAARRIVLGKYSNAGQMCVSPDYLIVHHSVKDRLLELMKKYIVQFFGDDPSTTYGYNKIINTKNFDRLTRYLTDGKIVTGGQYNRDTLFIAPTILDEVSPHAPVMKDEIFGPILPVFPFTTQEEALALIRRHPNPLSFYIFTSSKKKEQDWIEKVQFGSGCVNNTAMQFTNHHLPFGGVGQSGIGAYHGRDSFDVFTHYKSVMKTPAWFDPALKYPPLKGKMKLLKFFIK
jgi:aldehyde dehydrogenase (NAD+)